MKIIGYIICLTINILFFVRKKRSNLILAFTLGFIWIIMLGNMAVADYENYSYYYYNYRVASYQSPDYLYKFFVILGSNIGIDYKAFRGILNAFFLLIMNCAVRNLSKKNEHCFYAFYMMFTMFMDSIQLRFFYASSLVLLSVCLFQEEKRKKNLCAYIVLVVACFLHGGAVLFLFAWWLSRHQYFLKKYYKYIIFFIVLILVLLIKSHVLSDLASNITVLHRVSKYLKTQARFGFLAIWIMQIAVFEAIKYLKRKKVIDNEGEKIYQLIKISFLYLPLYLANVNFYRHIRLLSVLVILLGSRYLGKNGERAGAYIFTYKDINYIIHLMSIICIWLIYEIVFDKLATNILIPIFMI